MRLTLFPVLLVVSGWSLAQGSDVGLVNMVAGDVAYVSASKAAGKAQPFMRVREGDRFKLAPGSQLKIVFFEGGRQELWQGPGSFRAGRSASSPIAGKPVEATNLPVGASQRMAHVPDLMQHARLGGIQVRSTLTRKQEASLAQQENIREARATYAQMQKTASADDITPELYLYAALYEYLMYAEMSAVADEMLRKQPNNDDVKALAAWVRNRTPK
jgi:hypothetical protein